MAIRYVGNSPISRTDPAGAEGITIIDLNVAAPIRGIVKKYGVYTGNGATGFKIKIFYDDGTNYVFIGESAATNPTAGLTDDLGCWIVIEKGYYIGFYYSGPAGLYGPDMDTSGSATYKSGDVTTTTLKSGWNALSRAYSVRGKIFSRAGVL